MSTPSDPPASGSPASPSAEAGPAAAAPEQPAAAPAWDRRMLEALVCPETHAPLVFDPERMELVSRAAHLAYPIRGGIPVMLVDEARPLD